MNKKFVGEKSRNSTATPLKDAIEDMLSAFRLKSKFNETHLITSWENLMGSTIASRTTKLYIRDRVLYVTLNSAPLKNELSLSKKKVIQLLNQEAGAEVLVDVVFM